MVLVLACGAARADETLLLGPLELSGSRPVEAGPHMLQSGCFRSGAFLSGLEAEVVEAEGRPAPWARFLAGLSLSHPLDIDAHRAPRLALSSGAGALAFPAGFGMRLPKDCMFLAFAKVHGGVAGRSSAVFLRLTARTAEGSAARAGILEHVPLVIYPGGLEKARFVQMEGQAWWAPPGLRTYRTRAWLQFPGVVHLVTFNASRFAQSMRLEDASGTVLFQGAARTDDQGEVLSLPSYSSRTGFKVRRGQELVLSVTYDNPGPSDADVLGAAHLFIRPD